MSHYKQLTYEQRCQIGVLKKSGQSQRAMAKTLDVDQSTISRELKRNTGRRGHRHKQAQQRSVSRRQSAAKTCKMTPEVISLIEKKLALKWSPEQISGWLKLDRGVAPSHERIYQHVWQDKRQGGHLHTHLRRKGRRYLKRYNGKTSRGQIRNRVSIDERPAVVDKRTRIGDWGTRRREIDTVIGRGHSGALVTIVERASGAPAAGFTVSTRVNSKGADEVTAATIRLLTPYRDAVHTITADNGKEFAFHEKISDALEAQVYFAHPYHPWERGLNENTNGLLRQYWPKKTDFKKVKIDEVNAVVAQLNDRPRKKLSYQKPAQIMQNYMAHLAA